MIVYRKTLAQAGHTKVVLILDMMGAPTKPFFLCQLVREGWPPAVAVENFFLEQLPDATEALEAAMSISRGLICRATSTPMVEHEAHQLAALIKLHDDWTRTKALCLGFEQEGQCTDNVR